MVEGMKITQEHLYHGAVLNQIAEHPQFTAINSLLVRGRTSRSAFKINNDIAVFIKYATQPIGPYQEYTFGFNSDNLSELKSISDAGNELFLALVCVGEKEICCFSYDILVDLIAERRRQRGVDEDQYTILVTLNQYESFRVGMNAPGQRGIYVGERPVISRNACPNALFR